MATTKKHRLVARATETRRAPQPGRLRETAAQKKGYKIVAVSLYTPESEWVDSVTQTLRRAGISKANRSFVIQEAIWELSEELREKEPREIASHFIERQARRGSASV
jgi:hypothetical protein